MKKIWLTFLPLFSIVPIAFVACANTTTQQSTETKNDVEQDDNKTDDQINNDKANDDNQSNTQNSQNNQTNNKSNDSSSDQSEYQKALSQYDEDAKKMNPLNINSAANSIDQFIQRNRANKTNQARLNHFLVHTNLSISASKFPDSTEINFKKIDEKHLAVYLYIGSVKSGTYTFTFYGS